jgi:hypothetical protein
MGYPIHPCPLLDGWPTLLARSPRWLAKVGLNKEAIKTLADIKPMVTKMIPFWLLSAKRSTLLWKQKRRAFKAGRDSFMVVCGSVLSLECLSSKFSQPRN